MRCRRPIFFIVFICFVSSGKHYGQDLPDNSNSLSVQFWAKDEPPHYPVFFVPGDSCFPCDLEGFDALVAGEAPVDGAVTLDYLAPVTRSVNGAQGRGFSRITITGINERFVSSLALGAARAESARGRLRSTVDDAMPYIGGFPPWAVIVNRDFNVESYCPLIRYNEDWNKPPIPDALSGAFFSDRSDNYDPHVWMVEAVVDDWRNATKVRGLEFQFPQALSFSSKGPRRVISPVSVNVAEIKVIVFPEDDATTIFRRPLGLMFFVVDEEACESCTWIMRDGKVELLRHRES